MNAAGPALAIHSYPGGPTTAKPFELSPLPPRLIACKGSDEPSARPRRTKIWEFNTNLHCSIVGTCLSTSELRQTLRKIGLPTDGFSDHDLHGVGVTLAGRHDPAGRLLNKALDHRHKLAVSQFAKATTEEGVRLLWDEAVRRGEIPSAYWAALTHPLATQAIVRDAFNEVHMLSHLVGAANRADIRRLCQLEAEKSELQAKLQRQQAAFHDAVVSRDTQINDLRQALTRRIVSESAEDLRADTAALRDLASDLDRQLSGERRRRVSLEEKLTILQANLTRERSVRMEAERAGKAMRRELDTAEAAIRELCSGDHDGPPAAPDFRLHGRILLYVGGRPNQVAQIRTAIERLGGTCLHHDGGVENHPNLLPGLASRAEIVLFPVDCISHDAAGIVKSFCRQTGKPFVPLRSASITSLLCALSAPEFNRLVAAEQKG